MAGVEYRASFVDIRVKPDMRLSGVAGRTAPLVLAVLGSVLYCLVFIVRPMPWYPDWLKHLIGHPARWIHDALDSALRYVLGWPYDTHVRHGF